MYAYGEYDATPSAILGCDVLYYESIQVNQETLVARRQTSITCLIIHGPHVDSSSAPKIVLHVIEVSNRMYE